MAKPQPLNPQESVTCKNCDNIFTGNFCNECGQKANIHRLNLKHLFHNFFHALTHMDKGYLHTLKELTLRPGHSIREYLLGKRSNHSDPVMMLIIIGGLCSLIYNHYHIKTLTSLDLSKFKDEMQMFSLKFFALAFLGYSLILSLSDYLIFRYKGFNYIELFVMNIFTCIEILSMFIIMVPVWVLLHSYGAETYLRLTMIVMTYTYLVFVRYQFFNVSIDEKAKIRIWVDALAILLLFAVAGWKTWQNMLGQV